MADRRAVLKGAGLVTSLRGVYSAPLVGNQNVAVRSFRPISVLVADHAEWPDLESPLGDLQGSELPRPDAPYPTHFDPAGDPIYRERLRTASPPDSYNGPTFDVRHIGVGDHGRIKISCGLGRYFVSLATSEALDDELMKALERDPNQPVTLMNLPRRAWLHQRVADPVRDGRFRSAAVSIATVSLVAREKGLYRLLLATRSRRVATHPSFNHVIPAGIFSPFEVGDPREAYSVTKGFLSEYLEELYSYPDLSQRPLALEAEPPIQRLREMLEDDRANLLYTGISVNLLTLRPEICLLLLVHDAGWLKREQAADRPMSLNWENVKSGRVTPCVRSSTSRTPPASSARPR